LTQSADSGVPFQPQYFAGVGFLFSGVLIVAKMKVLKFHGSNLGMFCPAGLADVEGYITIHDSFVYQEMTRHELHLAASPPCKKLVRAAALVELAERDLEEWREAN
jgi:hypothetical protein